jgi:hypothetical protein
MLTGLTPTQLRQAADIQERILSLQSQLNQILGAPVPARAPAAPVAAKAPAAQKKRTMSPAAIERIRAAQRARWAKVRSGQGSTTQAARPGGGGKKQFSAATRAKLSQKLKAYWAARRSGKR